MKYIIETNGDNAIKDVEGEQAWVAVGGYMLIGKLHLYTEPEWIPCSDRLPKEGKSVIVNVIARDAEHECILMPVGMAEEAYENGWIDAWMPLPVAYGGNKRLPIIGDEVIKPTDDTKAAVLDLINGDGDCIVLTEDGCVERWDAWIFERTGINHPQIADILEELQEEEE